MLCGQEPGQGRNRQRRDRLQIDAGEIAVAGGYPVAVRTGRDLGKILLFARRCQGIVVFGTNESERNIRMDAKQKLALKGRGFIPQKEDGYFNMRVITDCGNLTAQQLRVLAEIAQEYGRGYLGATTRLTVELPWIKAEDVETVAKLVSDAGMQIGGTGKRVRAVVACKLFFCRIFFIYVVFKKGN